MLVMEGDIRISEASISRDLIVSVGRPERTEMSYILGARKGKRDMNSHDFADQEPRSLGRSPNRAIKPKATAATKTKRMDADAMTGVYP